MQKLCQQGFYGKTELHLENIMKDRISYAWMNTREVQAWVKSFLFLVKPIKHRVFIDKYKIGMKIAML